MEEYHQITLDEWSSWVEDIRKKLSETAQNFVYIGYRLKQIRDSGNFGGASDVFEFAQKEYGISKSAVSRFIAINEKYSEGGNSLELKEQYKGFSSSKLSEMLSLPDSECELITEETTVKQIRELKSFDRQQVSGDTAKTEGDSPLRTVIIDYFKDKRDDLNDILRLIYDGMVKDAAELMNPSGIGTHNKGICFLFMYEYDKGIKYKLLTEQQPRSMSWSDFLHEVYAVYESIWESGEGDVWSMYYGGEAVATSQQETSDIPMNKPEESEQAAGVEEEDKSEEPIIPKAEEESEKEESPESTELPEDEEEGKPEKPEESKAEEAKEDEEPEKDDKDTIHNQAAFRSAKDALVRINQAFEEGQYHRAMDMADAFSMHLDIALRRTV